MNCYDCATHARTTAAVALCVDCGVAVCIEHADVTPRRLTRTGAMNRTIAVEPAARTVRCHQCQAAVDATSGLRGRVASPVHGGRAPARR
jgi:hypothetical protein